VQHGLVQGDEWNVTVPTCYSGYVAEVSEHS
jgi:hypothetical protein